jgi:glycosyltransferase involved in cell wall biosynthesis
MKTVLIIEGQIKEYRRPFYERLRSDLARSRIDLKVAYSDPAPEELQKGDNCDLSSDYGIKVKAYRMAGGRLLFQPLFRSVASADLVIIDHANKFILNHLLLPMSLCRLKKVAFWGLAENLQADRSEISEWYKRRTLLWVDWWFAYTEGTAAYLRQHGVNPSRITAVQNSIDTRLIRDVVAQMDEDIRVRLRVSLGISASARVGIYVGMLEEVKRIPFLLEAAEQIRSVIPDFHLILVGGGSGHAETANSVKDKAWIHCTGPKLSRQKAEFLAIADCMLMPGRVGLAVLDAFAAALPVLATRLAHHGPEIEYLQDGFNGVLTAPDVNSFASGAVRLFTRRDELLQLGAGARISASRYSIESMAENFRVGIERCLNWPPMEANQAGWRSRLPQSAS